MFKTKTLFVVGAGASKEFGLPLGNELTGKIADKLRISSNGAPFSASVSSQPINFAVGHMAQLSADMFNVHRKYMIAADMISEAMPAAISIDNFLEAHKDSKEIAKMGKMAIVEAIIEAEANSKAYNEENEAFRVSRLNEVWILNLFKMLTEGVDLENVSSIFNNISIVCFNYDRCIEVSFLQLLNKYYGVSPEEAANILEGLVIIHPYGSLGDLNDWGWSGFGKVRVTRNIEQFMSLSERIYTFSEQLADNELIERIHSAVSNAETLVFLGFAYHPQNMKLLQPKPSKMRVRRIFATALGVSGYDVESIRQDVLSTLNGARNLDVFEVRNDLTAQKFFEEYARTLPRGA
ncbi:hypothetical protein [Thalassospira tepidiphila]|uniref:hypothetical protein n=1 Tax=Thalassospira tepidiphila TaxID=393657 RepID=UPI003AA9495A